MVGLRRELEVVILAQDQALDPLGPERLGQTLGGLGLAATGFTRDGHRDRGVR